MEFTKKLPPPLPPPKGLIVITLTGSEAAELSQIVKAYFPTSEDYPSVRVQFMQGLREAVRTL